MERGLRYHIKVPEQTSKPKEKCCLAFNWLKHTTICCNNNRGGGGGGGREGGWVGGWVVDKDIVHTALL